MGVPSPAEELAWMIKDNLYAKHLVLSVEELFVEFLECPLSEEETLALEPMVSYQRMLLHRLADLFGLAHESVGEGDERHLVVEKSEDSLIPAVLVSDVLDNSSDGETHNPQSSRQLLRRNAVPSDGLEGTPVVNSPAVSLEERQASYLAARHRIFSETWKHSEESPKEEGCIRPRADPVVARRMIAHALGKAELLSISSPSMDVIPPQHFDVPSAERRIDKGWIENSPVGKMASFEESKESMQQSSVKAAKRIFANALGLTPGGISPRPANRHVSCKLGSAAQPSQLGENPVSSSSAQCRKHVPIDPLDPHGAACEGILNSTKGVSMAQTKSTRLARPGVAACRIFAQALGLPDPGCSSEISRPASIHRSSSLASV